MTYIAEKPTVRTLTCAQCPHFNNYHDPMGRGWCKLFDHQAREHHQQTNDCVVSSDPEFSHELEDNLSIFSNIDLDAFPTEEPESELDKPYSEYQVGSIVKVIDPTEHHSEWATFVIIGRQYNHELYRSTKAYLSETAWYYWLVIPNYESTYAEPLWVAENEICLFDEAHLISTEDIF